MDLARGKAVARGWRAGDSARLVANPLRSHRFRRTRAADASERYARGPGRREDQRDTCAAISHQLAQPEHVLGAARPPAQRVSCGGWLAISFFREPGQRRAGPLMGSRLDHEQQCKTEF